MRLSLPPLLSFLIAATGQWEKAMITVYLCGISTLIAMAIGLPIAIWVAERDRWWTVTRLVIDTLQTLPSFVYLMPIVMLFRVGDFTAMLAVAAMVFAVAEARADALADILKKGVVRIAVPLDVPPFGSVNQQRQPEGFDIDQARSLGLSIARQFAKQLGGTLVMERRPEGGTEARLEFSY